MAASCSPAASDGSLMRKLFVSTTHCAEASAQDSRSMQIVTAGLGTRGARPRPLVDGVLCPSIWRRTLWTPQAQVTVASARFCTDKDPEASLLQFLLDTSALSRTLIVWLTVCRNSILMHTTKAPYDEDAMHCPLEFWTMHWRLFVFLRCFVLHVWLNKAEA